MAPSDCTQQILNKCGIKQSDKEQTYGIPWPNLHLMKEDFVVRGSYEKGEPEAEVSQQEPVSLEVTGLRDPFSEEQNGRGPWFCFSDRVC